LDGERAGQKERGRVGKTEDERLTQKRRKSGDKNGYLNRRMDDDEEPSKKWRLRCVGGRGK